ncbi:MAG: carbonic anhydrase [Pirellulales bacterium]|nr:carbonic anhydrase [Pirellulales bacterium]
MHRLIPGIQEFHENVFPAHRERFEELALGQKPSTLFITCSDSRIVPQLLTQTQPGELFVIRNAGNLVPPHSENPSGEAATIEFAIQALKVEEIIVCGHSHCGAITGLLRPHLIAGMPSLGKWLKYAEETLQELETPTLQQDPDDDRLTRAMKANVLVQIKHLRTHPVVAEALEQGELRLHGGFYRIETGEVTVLDEAQRKFVSIAELLEETTSALTGG